MYSTARCIALAGVLVIGASGALAQHHNDLRSGKLRPTVGNISNEVAIARLRMSGVENPSVVRREGSRLYLRGMVQGKQTDIEFNASNGHAFETGPTRRMLIGPRGTVDRFVVKGKQVPGDHRAISNPNLMKGVVTPHK